MGVASPSSALTSSSFALPRAAVRPHRNPIFPHHRCHFSLRVANESKGTELSTVEVSEADKIVDGMDFGELCNEFECISSPLVESTARLLLRDILELQKGNRSREVYAALIKYKSMQEMAMLWTSVLNIKWTLRGTPKSIMAVIGGPLIIRVDSKFILNQISGQVIEHEEEWDLSGSSIIAQLFFWTSRRLFATTEAGRNVADFVKNLNKR